MNTQTSLNIEYNTTLIKNKNLQISLEFENTMNFKTKSITMK